MEKRKYNYTPRERIDDSLLLEILRENEPSCTGYGSYESRNSSQGSCRTQSGNTRRTSSRESNNSRGYAREYSDSDGSGTGSGCTEKCITDSCINKYTPAMVYCPDQDWGDLYEIEDALVRGTLFKVLDFPFYGGACNSCK